MQNEYIRLVLAILATFRIARLLPLDDGPLYIFERVRLYVAGKSNNETNIKHIKLGFWSSVYDGVTCPYCQGLYVAILCSVLLVFQSVYGDMFLVIFALAGAQSLLQGWMEK